MADEKTYTIMEGCELPSGGKIYDVDVNQHVELRSMTGREELRRRNPTNQPLKVMADIIEGCMLEKPAVHVYDMAIGDYEYLLHKIRIVTDGPMYKMSLKCPFCGEVIEAETNLEDQDMYEFDADDFNSSRTFELPVSKDTITIKFLTPHLLEEADTKATAMKRKYASAGIDFKSYAQLIVNIQLINGQLVDEISKQTYIDNMPALDMQYIFNKIQEVNKKLGLDDTLYLTCPDCGKEIKTFFRNGPEFFEPTNI